MLRGRQHKLLKYDGFTVFVEVQRRAPEMLIVGGGHIALPLAQLASMCDFAVTVLDDRPGFVSEERFPTATTTHRRPAPRDRRRACPSTTTPSSSSSPAATATTSSACSRCWTGPRATSA